MSSPDSAHISGASTEVIRPWFVNFYIPGHQVTKLNKTYKMDEAGIMEGLGENGLVVSSA